MNTKKPKICFVAEHHCSRVAKEAIVLRQLGYEVHMVSSSLRFVEEYDSFSFYTDVDQFIRTVRDFRKIDIWQVHNEPAWPLWTLRELHPKAKIILDYHDSNRWRLYHTTAARTGEKLSWYNEDVAVMCADGFVVPSEACKKEVKTRTDRPVAFLPSATPLSWYPTRPYGFWGGVVIEGGVSMKGHDEIDRWRDYSELVKVLSEKSEVYIYSPSWGTDASDPLVNHYIDLGAKIGNMAPKELLNRLGEHTWNVVGNWQNPRARVWDFALPNKFFEGAASGIPCVSFGVPEADRFIEKYDIGIVIGHPDELVERWDEHIEKRRNLYLCRRELAMERFIGNLTKLYDGL